MAAQTRTIVEKIPPVFALKLIAALVVLEVVVADAAAEDEDAAALALAVHN